MSKPKIAAAFALGFIAGSSKWLWISILCSGILYFVSSLDFTQFAIGQNDTDIGLCLIGAVLGFIAGHFVGYCFGTGPTNYTGVK